MNNNYNELFTALAKAQSEMKTAGLNAENPYFKSSYADFAEIVRVSRPALTKNGLCIIQNIIINHEGNHSLKTILGHSSGQWIESEMKLQPTKTDIQSLASYITYVKRYAYAALIGVVTSNEDDDGENAMPIDRNLNRSQNPTDIKITDEQLEQLEHELQGQPFIAKQVLDGLKITTLSQMPRARFLSSINRIRELKNTQK